MAPETDLTATCRDLIDHRWPNFFRPWNNPFVVQACYCLSEYVRTTWHHWDQAPRHFQSFLANSLHEALSGAIKLLRYNDHHHQRTPRGLIVDFQRRVGSFADASVDGQPLVFLPAIKTVSSKAEFHRAVQDNYAPWGFVAVVTNPQDLPGEVWEDLIDLLGQKSRRVIVCVDRAGLDHYRNMAQSLMPDVVVFDESFTHRLVPFAAFSADRSLFRAWNRPHRSSFHSTTFQPNSLATLHFLKCLQQDDPAFYSQVHEQLQQIAADARWRLRLLAKLYSPMLAKTIRTLGLEEARITVDGHYVNVNGRPIFDGVAGVACSVRGHNPKEYINEVARFPSDSQARTLGHERLAQLTGLHHVLPAVSGAAAVEHGLRVALAAQHPRPYVLALQGGFGGKTLLALTATARSRYKERLGPLYPQVIYIDPFAESVIEQLDSAFSRFPIAVVALELIQAVGGVRAVPEKIVHYLRDHRDRWGYLLMVDEVQTGMYRTGPFCRSRLLNLQPDIMTLGKGTSDMMVPYALTLYSNAIHQRLDQRHCRLPEEIHQHHDYPWADRTVLNVLDVAEQTRLAEHVTAMGSLFEKLLTQQLAACPLVRGIRVYGLLIAIELAGTGPQGRWLSKPIARMALLSMFNHANFPILIGFCQYEPNVLKLTPPLSITPDEVESICATMAEVLRRGPLGIMAAALGSVLSRRKLHHPSRLQAEEKTHEPAAC
jgi:acetylornithine/succinyldiaminopimelate/putrescine aminotransferase